MSNIVQGLKAARQILLDCGFGDADPELTAMNVAILEREASPVTPVTPLKLHFLYNSLVAYIPQKDVRQAICEEWHTVVKEHGLKPGTTVEKVIGRLLNRIDGATL